MAQTRYKFDAEFRAGAVRIVTEIGEPIAQVPRDLWIHGGSLGNWTLRIRPPGRATAHPGARLSGDEQAELTEVHLNSCSSVLRCRCGWAAGHEGPAGRRGSGWPVVLCGHGWLRDGRRHRIHDRIAGGGAGTVATRFDVSDRQCINRDGCAL